MPVELMIPPAVIMMLGALVLPILPRVSRRWVFLVFPAAALVVIWTMPDGMRITADVMGTTLVLCKVDQLARLFAAIFALVVFAGGIYALHVKDTGEQVAALVYGGGAIGIALAGDFFTLLVFWEVIAIASAYLVWARRDSEAHRAGMRYLIVHLFGGSMLLAGILLHLADTGSMEIMPLTGSKTPASWLILGGVALNAALPPLHAWLADAYPRATVTGAVFLSALTTKSAVYVLARVFPGTELLLVMGVMMAVYGVVFAVLANDIREILAYHIISQVGYMVAGVGIGTTLALNGTVAHAISHILYKALLFMGAGVVLHTTGKSKLTELGGLAAVMPVTLWLYMVGAFSISGFPLFNGFISKSMVVSAAGEAHWDTAMLLLSLASVGTFLHTGLKLPYFTWYSESKGLKPDKPPVNMHIGMALVAFLCILFGVLPSILYRYLPYPVAYEPYTLYHLTETTQLLLFTFGAFWLFRASLAGEPTLTLDTDWFYRRPAAFLNRLVVQSTGALFDRAERTGYAIAGWLAGRSNNPTGSPSAEFLPDEHRPPMSVVIGAILLVFSLVVVLALLVP